MHKHVLAAAVLAMAAQASAAIALGSGAAPVLRVSRGAPGGPVLYATDATALDAACLGGAGDLARLYFTFLDPQGVDYAGVDLRADSVRPPVSDHAEAYLWVNPGTREDRAYRYRHEAEAPGYEVRYTMPIVVEVLPAEGPLDIHVETKDPAGNLAVVNFQLSAEQVLCS